MKKQAPLKNKKAKHLEKPEPIDKIQFIDLAKHLGLKASEEEYSALLQYLNNLMLWNTRINLVGSLEWRTVFSELIMDSYYLKDFMLSFNLSNPTTWDLGSGAGLPGIPLRILWNKGEYTLVEAREKRALFMTNFLLKTPSENTQVFWGRAEHFFEEKKAKENFADMIVSRAFMPYEELMEFVFPYLEKGSRLVLMLNENIENISLHADKWQIEKSKEYIISLLDSKSTHRRYFHSIRKI